MVGTWYFVQSDNFPVSLHLSLFYEFLSVHDSGQSSWFCHLSGDDILWLGTVTLTSNLLTFDSDEEKVAISVEIAIFLLLLRFMKQHVPGLIYSYVGAEGTTVNCSSFWPYNNLLMAFPLSVILLIWEILPQCLGLCYFVLFF